jgi:histidine triad (HIT) family protein
VFEDEHTIAFLDVHPVFPGHVLVSPKPHFVTLNDLPREAIGPLFGKVQLLAKAVESALEADGTFVAINNTIGQTVPHLHVHVIPRRRRDGLKGFFWPRHDYQDDQARQSVREAIERELVKLLQG